MRRALQSKVLCFRGALPHPLPRKSVIGIIDDNITSMRSLRVVFILFRNVHVLREENTFYLSLETRNEKTHHISMS